MTVVLPEPTTAPAPRFDDDYDAALRWANEQRRKQGMEPLGFLPRGMRLDSDKCPLARATGQYISGLSVSALSSAPTPVKRFVRRFDRGEYPELEVAA